MRKFGRQPVGTLALVTELTGLAQHFVAHDRRRAAGQQRGPQLAVGVDVIAQVEDGFEPVQPRHHRGGHRHQRADFLRGDIAKQGFLGRVMAEEGGIAGPGARRNLADGDLVERGFLEQFEQCSAQRLARTDLARVLGNIDPGGDQAD